jgi:hypothetical protein
MHGLLSRDTILLRGRMGVDEDSSSSDDDEGGERGQEPFDDLASPSSPLSPHSPPPGRNDGGGDGGEKEGRSVQLEEQNRRLM